MKYKVKFYKKDYYYFYLFEDKKIIYKCLGFSDLISFLDSNHIDYKNVRFNCTLRDLFYHVVDYKSVRRTISFDDFEKQKMLKINGGGFNV